MRRPNAFVPCGGFNRRYIAHRGYTYYTTLNGWMGPLYIQMFRKCLAVSILAFRSKRTRDDNERDNACFTYLGTLS